MKLWAFVLSIGLFLMHPSAAQAAPAKKMALDKWTYIQVDNSRSRYDGKQSGDGYWFGLAMGDVTGDGFADIVSGKWFYRNPGADMAKSWQRVALADSMDASLIVDVDGDAFGDIIALKCGKQYWFEAQDKLGRSWKGRLIGEYKVCNHGTSTQGYNLAQIIAGGRPEILLHGESIFCISIPDDPEKGFWPAFEIATPGGNGEWLAAADMDLDGDVDVTAGFLKDQKTQLHDIVWLENPGDGHGPWPRHAIGESRFRADKTLPGDFNGDGRIDLVVSEERYPGAEPDASMYWYQAPQDPKQQNWSRHTIVTQWSMNNLDVADLDNDGDLDLVTCEHKGPAEELQIWENNGNGVFVRHTIDIGKESHLGARLADMDRDGDLDIVSIAWCDYPYLHLWRNDAIMGKGTGTVKTPPLGLAEITDQSMQLDLTVLAGAFDRFDKPVEVELDFNKLSAAGFDAASLHVLEVDANGNVMNPSVVFQWDPAAQKGKGNLVFMADGCTPAHSQRFFSVLFGPEGGYYVQPVFAKLVSFDAAVPHEGESSFKIVTPRATYYYHKAGSGFASMNDLDGNDWIGFNPLKVKEEGAKGEYRGIPNIAPPNFHPGRGDGHKMSQVISQGPCKLKFLSETKDEKWGLTWEIYPTYATMTLFKKGEEPYWILYEGTPGGEFDLEDYGVNSKGETFALPDMVQAKKWNGDLPDPEWVYFSDGKLNRSLYLIHHEYSDAIDEYWHFGQGGMTVFGFGRGPRESGWQRLTQAPTHLTIGFAESREFGVVSKWIDSAYQKLDVKIGRVTKMK